jgi:hypothetical protein
MNILKMAEGNGVLHFAKRFMIKELVFFNLCFVSESCLSYCPSPSLSLLSYLHSQQNLHATESVFQTVGYVSSLDYFAPHQKHMVFFNKNINTQINNMVGGICTYRVLRMVVLED